MSFDPDVVYNNLSLKEQKAIDEQAEKELRESDPYYEHKAVGFMKSTLKLMKRREIIYRKYRGNVKPPSVPVIEEDEKDVEIRELKEEINELKEQLKARDRKILELEFARDMLEVKEGGEKHAA